MDWKVGDKVTIHDYYNGPAAVRQVVSVSPRFMTDSKGDKWAPSGRLFGCANERYYTGRKAYPFEQGDITSIHRRKAIALLRETKWDALDTELLKAVCNLITPAPAVSDKEVG